MKKDSSPIGMPMSRICTERSPTIADKNEIDVASHSDGVVALPTGFPFELKSYTLSPSRTNIVMTRTYNEDYLRASLSVEDDQVSCDDPFIPFYVEISKDYFMAMDSEMIAKPDRIHIHEVYVSDLSHFFSCPDENMKKFKEYLKTRGITSKTISFAYDRLRYKQKNGLPSKST